MCGGRERERGGGREREGEGGRGREGEGGRGREREGRGSVMESVSMCIKKHGGARQASDPW